MTGGCPDSVLRPSQSMGFARADLRSGSEDQSCATCPGEVLLDSNAR